MTKCNVQLDNDSNSSSSKSDDTDENDDSSDSSENNNSSKDNNSGKDNNSDEDASESKGLSGMSMPHKKSATDAAVNSGSVDVPTPISRTTQPPISATNDDNDELNTLMPPVSAHDNDNEVDTSTFRRAEAAPLPPSLLSTIVESGRTV